MEDRYYIEAVIEAGPQSIVYKVKDINSQKVLVLKRIIPNKNRSFDVQEKTFLQNTGLLSSLSHWGIPPVYEGLVSSGDFYTAMKFLQGQDLQLIMDQRNNAPLPADQVIIWLSRLMEILDYLHRLNPPIILRELKPSKIIISPSQEVCLLHAEALLLLDDQNDVSISSSPGFCAPEQLKGIHSPAGSLYSAGAIAHYLLTGTDPADPFLPPFVFDKISVKNPGIEPWLEDLIFSMLKMNPKDRPQSAAEILTYFKRSQRGRDSASGLFNKGISYYNKGEYEKAVDRFTKLLIIDPDNEKAFLWRGMAKSKMYNIKGALADFSEALEIDPLYTAALCSRGEILTRMGDSNKALMDFNLAISIEPNYTEAYKGRGSAYRYAGRFEDALRDFSNTIKLDPRCDEAYYLRGLIYLDLGEMEKALRDFNKALEINPENSEVYAGRAMIYDRKGDFYKSIEDNTRAIQINPCCQGAHYSRAMALRNLGFLKEALEDLKEAVRLDPEDPDPLNEMGVVLYQLGRDMKAIEFYTKAIELEPDFAEAYYNRSLANKRQGFEDDAKRDFDRYNRLTKS